MTTDRFVQARDIVMSEGWLLDTRQWDAWLALYDPSATYWLPCWLDEDHLTSDPKSQISLIYYSSRAGLEDRVFRIRTGQSLASTPLSRTAHLISIGHAREVDGKVEVGSSWAVHSIRGDAQHVFFGQQTHVFAEGDTGLKIVERRVVLANDRIPNVLDIYSV